MIKIIRYVIPSNEKEATVPVRGRIVHTGYTKFADTDQNNVEIYIEEDDEKPVETLTIRSYETGESIPSYASHLATVNSANRLPQHLYVVWSSLWKEDENAE